jgi:hypothetical protein
VPALETEQSRVMRWGFARMEELSGRALIECIQEGGSCGMDLPRDSVYWHLDKREVRRQGQGLSGVQGRVAIAMEKGAPRSATETNRRRDLALHETWWAQSEVVKRGEETNVLQEGRRGNVLLL